MFLQTQRMSGKGSKITVIEPSQYLEFFETLKNDSSMDPQFKAFLAIAVSGGCRVSEALSIRVGSVDSDGHFKVKALKKNRKKKNKFTGIVTHSDREVIRPCMLCPTAHQIVKEYCKNLNPFDLMFKFHRATVHRHIKKHFGPNACSHSIARHSHISWLLHDQNISNVKVGVEMAMLTHVVDLYNHANIEVEQANRFKKAV